MPTIHDSGTREEFSTGAQRDTAADKSRPDLISPYARLRIGEWLRQGAAKYQPRNWEKGIPFSRCIASSERHLCDYLRGSTDEDHLAALGCNIVFLLHFEEMIRLGKLSPTLNDLPQYEKALTSRQTIGQVLGEWVGDMVEGWEKDREETGLPTPTPTFYIAGPMRGIKMYNFPAFDAARDRGREMGFNIISPADIDREDGFKETDEVTPEMCRKFAERDTRAILSLRPERGDGIAVLEGWADSTGAKAEVALARWLGLRVVFAKDFRTEVPERWWVLL